MEDSRLLQFLLVISLFLIFCITLPFILANPKKVLIKDKNDQILFLDSELETGKIDKDVKAILLNNNVFKPKGIYTKNLNGKGYSLKLIINLEKDFKPYDKDYIKVHIIGELKKAGIYSLNINLT